MLGIKGNFESPKVAFEKKKPSLFETMKEMEENEVSTRKSGGDELGRHRF